jgi:hypothetical protein
MGVPPDQPVGRFEILARGIISDQHLRRQTGQRPIHDHQQPRKRAGVTEFSMFVAVQKKLFVF